MMPMVLRVVLALIVTAVAAAPANAQGHAAVPGPCVPGALPSGALSLTCVPSAGWNGEIVVFAHGYVPAGLPLGFYNLLLPDGTHLPTLVQSLGYAFATTSYRQNGLAILEGTDDIVELVASVPSASRTHLVGVSEGGLVATLLAERRPELFSSAVAACAPIGSFQAQIDSFGDFRVLFDYFFPGIIPGSPIAIPPAVVAGWASIYVPRVAAALAANPARALQLMRVSRAAYDPANPATIVTTAVNMLSYNVLGANDAVLKLGGNPFSNRLRWYFGSSNDLKLNLSVQRFTAVAAARAALASYETNGNLSIPVVTLHTTGDEVIPFWHEVAYLPKLDLSARGRFVPIPAFRYGHCNFSQAEVVAAFAVAVRLP